MRVEELPWSRPTFGRPRRMCFMAPSMTQRIPVVLLFWAAALSAGTQLQNRVTGQPLRWPSTSIALKLSRTVHLASGDTGVDRRDSAGNVHAAVASAARAWADASRLTVTISLVDQQQIQPGDNLITFTDPTLFDQGVCSKEAYVGCAVHWYFPDGTLAGISIAFNPYKKHSSIGLKGTHDIGLTALHEIGHGLGLDHSPVLDAIMSPALEVDTGDSGAPTFPARVLSRDDIYTLASAYPELASDAGRISGVVSRNGGPEPRAQVVAIDDAGRVVQSAVPGPAGNYSMAVPPGDLTLVAVGGFAPWFWTAGGGSGTDREVVSLEPGTARTRIDFAIGPGVALGIRTIGYLDGDSYFGFGSITLGRGRDYVVAVSRTVAEGTPTIEIPAALGDFTGPGANLLPDAPGIYFRPINISASAAPGAYAVLVRNETSAALLPGGIRIVASPNVEGVRNPETGEAGGTYRAGQRISIFGSELAAVEAAGVAVIAGTPLPTQVAGVSVRVGERFAQVVSVSPGEIIAIMPEGLSGDKVEVTVLSGPAVGSKPVAVDFAQ